MCKHADELALRGESLGSPYPPAHPAPRSPTIRGSEIFASRRTPSAGTTSGGGSPAAPPALVEDSIGAGRALLFTSTLDRDWNDLPIHPGFLPLMQQAVRHLARKHAAFGGTDHTVGSSVVLPTGDLKKVEVRGPDGTGTVFEGDRIVGRSSVRYGKTDRTGIYRVIGTDQTGSTHERDELAFVVNVDAHGSNLTPAPAAMLPPSGTGGAGAPVDTTRRIELWHALAAAVLLLLLAEGLLVQR